MAIFIVVALVACSAPRVPREPFDELTAAGRNMPRESASAPGEDEERPSGIIMLAAGGSRPESPVRRAYRGGDSNG